MKLKQLLASPPIFNDMLISCSFVRIALLRINFLFARISLSFAFIIMQTGTM
jgi:hypothetical protein